jgi:ferredoxin
MTRLLLQFSKQQINFPITSQVILEQGVLLNILRAHVEPTFGEILVEVPHESVDRIVNAFQKRGVKATVQRRLEVDNNRCISCGACYSLCPISVISFEEDCSIVFEGEKCIACGLCIDACPTQALHI